MAAGYRYGSQLPKTIYGPLFFADQDWKKPNRLAYMAGLQKHRPVMATVLDWERDTQLAEVLDWAEEAASYVERVLIIPKVIGGICLLPRRIGGAEVVLAYSVPTRYGATQVPIWEFGGWPIHLLGGSPQRQMSLWRYLSVIADVVSADGNYALRMATKRCQFWVHGTAYNAHDRWWPTLSEADGRNWNGDGPCEAFKRSCFNIRRAWMVTTGGGNQRASAPGAKPGLGW